MGMNNQIVWILRVLALCHFAWSGVLLLAAGWIALSTLLVLPHMSTGTIWTNLPLVMMGTMMYALLPASLGIWMGILGRGLWSPGTRLRTRLLWTHGVLLLCGSLAVVGGIQAVEAANLSSARGGGLLSPYAWVPVLFGVPVVVLASCTLSIALAAFPEHRSRGAWPAGASASSTSASATKAMALLVVVLTLLASVLVVGLRPIWPANPNQEAAQELDTTPASTRRDIDALRGINKKPPRERRDFLRSAIMNGRLGLMSLADRDATSALVVSYIPTALECHDVLEMKINEVMARIQKQRGPRTMADGKLDDEYLELTNRMHSLLAALNDIERIPIGLESYLAERAARNGAARSIAIALMEKIGEQVKTEPSENLQEQLK